MSRLARSCLAALAASIAGALVAPSTGRADYPIFFQRYTADPGTLEHGGRLYLYASHDLDTQTGYEMYDITCISTDDLKNWTDHGECFNARTGSTWAQYSWAPSVVARNDKFYLYYGNSGSSVGVAVADSPIGPFRDTRGRALVDGSTPGVNATSGMWLFDPSAFVDDDGKAYLYFGGNGPSNIRVIQLGTDMVSTVGSATSMTAPRFFEASWMHKYNGRYYFSYSTNWDLGAPTIDYMTSSSPTSGFQHRGTVLPQPPENGNNNHAGIFKFQNNWYIAYHNRTLARLDGVDATYHRNLALDRLTHNADGTIQQATITTNGVPQLKSLNPYVTVEAETMNREQGIETEACSEGGRDVSSISNGDWVRVVGVDFGAGATKLEARVASAASGGSIQVRLGSSTGTLVATCAVPGTGGWQTWTTVSCNVTGATGVKDVYFVFTGGSGNLFNFNWWKFTSGSTTTYPLDVTKAGTGSGTVTSSPSGISCGTTCNASYASGTTVTLTAAAASGSTFAGWSDGCTGTSATCTVSMTAARAVTATFDGPMTGPVSINAGGAATGTWVADTGFSGGSTYSVTTAIDTSLLGGTIPPQAVLQTERYGEFTYTLGGFTPGSAQAVTLYFAEVYWTAAGQRTFNVAVNGSAALTAFDIYAAAGGTGKAISRTFDATASASGQIVVQFTKGGGPDNPKVCAIVVGGSTPGYPLTVTRAGTGSGTVAGGGINCGATCSASYASGTTVTLTATPASGSSFTGWSGACTGTGACIVSMTAARSVTATFTGPVDDRVLAVTKAGTGSGTVTSSTGGINCGSSCTGILPPGTVVTLTASAAAGSTFTSWGGACSGAAATCTLTMSEPRTVTATFTLNQNTCKTPAGSGQSGNFETTGAVCYTVNATVHGWGCSNVDGRTVTVNGTSVTCGQTPLPGSAPYTFSFTAGSYPWASFYWW